MELYRAILHHRTPLESNVQVLHPSLAITVVLDKFWGCHNGVVEGNFEVAIGQFDFEVGLLFLNSENSALWFESDIFVLDVVHIKSDIKDGELEVLLDRRDENLLHLLEKLQIEGVAVIVNE
jgi:hypothetical protein